MNDQELAERFCLDVDRIIQNPSEEIKTSGLLPDEYMQAIELARFMVLVGLIDQFMKKDELRRLLDMAGGRDKGRASGEDDELDDQQLDMVAAGAGSETQGDNYPVTGCGRRASDIKGGACPDCGRPRGLHPEG